MLHSHRQPGLLHDMADQTELAFVRNFVKTIAVQPVAFEDDYQAPPHLALRRVPILSVRITLRSAPGLSRLVL